MSTQFKWIFLIGGIFSVLAGLYLFFQPVASLASLTFVFSVVMLVNGIAEVIRYFSEKENRTGALLASGILTIILSICLLSSSPLGLVSFIPYMFALWILMSACTRVVLSFAKRKINKTDANYLLIMGILGIIASMFLFGHPLFTGLIVAYMIGFSFVYQGIANLVIFYKFSKQE